MIKSFLCFIPSVCLVVTTSAQSLDPNYGNGGSVITDFANDYDQAFQGAIDYQGRAITMGRIYVDAEWHTGIQRLLPNGDYDASFGNNGLAEFEDFALTNALAVGPDGKILVGGAINGADGTADIQLLMLNEDGSIDEGFGEGYGLVLSIQENTVESCFALEIQPDGKILVGGFIGEFTSSAHLLIRLEADGSMDYGFGNFGVVSLPTVLDYEYVSKIKALADGSIYYFVEGPVVSDDTGLIIKLNEYGNPSSDFGGDGTVNILEEGFFLDPSSFGVLPDGAVEVTGVVSNAGTAAPCKIRFEPTGTPDLDYGVNGAAIVTSDNNVYAYESATFADGSSILMGLTDELVLIKLTPDGAVDPLFGEGGFWQPDPTILYDSGVSLFVTSDNAIVIMGSSYAFMADFFTVKVLPDVVDLILEQKELSVNVYPNPSSDLVYASVPANETIEVCIYDIAGDRVFQGTTKAGSFQVDVSAFPSGNYQIVCRNGEEVYQSALMVTH